MREVIKITCSYFTFKSNFQSYCYVNNTNDLNLLILYEGSNRRYLCKEYSHNIGKDPHTASETRQSQSSVGAILATFPLLDSPIYV